MNDDTRDTLREWEQALQSANQTLHLMESEQAFLDKARAELRMKVEQDINYQRLLKMHPDADKTLILTELCAFLLLQREQSVEIWNAALKELPDEYRQQLEEIQRRIVYRIPDKGILEGGRR